MAGFQERRKKKKRKIWAEICMAACRQGDPLACCLLLACQRKLCPCPEMPLGFVPPFLVGKARSSVLHGKAPPGTTPSLLFLPLGWGQVSPIPEFGTSWVVNAVWCSLLSHWVLPLTSAASRLLQLHGKFRITELFHMATTTWKDLTGAAPTNQSTVSF